MFNSSTVVFFSFATLWAIAFTLSACNNDFLLISGIPEILATSSNSSTATGSTIYDSTPADSAIARAINPPRLDACSP